MKKSLTIIMGLLLVVMIFSMGSTVSAAPAQSGDGDSVVVAVSSFPVAGNAGWTNMSASISSSTYKVGRITRITISNDDNKQAQTVTFYDNVTSTASLTKIWEVIVGTSQAGSGLEQETFSDSNPLTFFKGLLVRKSHVESNITVSIKYK